MVVPIPVVKICNRNRLKIKKWEIESSKSKRDRQYNVQEKNINDKRLATKQYTENYPLNTGNIKGVPEGYI